jgi:hypothetical protein
MMTIDMSLIYASCDGEVVRISMEELIIFLDNPSYLTSKSLIRNVEVVARFRKKCHD